MQGHGWYAANLALGIMAADYARLFLIGLLYTSVFHTVSHRLAKISRERLEHGAMLVELDCEISRAAAQLRSASGQREQRVTLFRELSRLGDDVRRLKERFVGFANGLWFDEVCTQIQGREIFARLMQELPVRVHYQEIKDEIERSDALEEQDAARRSARLQTEITVVGAMVGAVVFCATVGPWITSPNYELPASLSWLVRMLLAVVIIAFAPVVLLAMTELRKPADALTEVAWLLRILGRTGWKSLRAAGSWLRRLLTR